MTIKKTILETEHEQMCSKMEFLLNKKERIFRRIEIFKREMQKCDNEITEIGIKLAATTIRLAKLRDAR